MLLFLYVYDLLNDLFCNLTRSLVEGIPQDLHTLVISAQADIICGMQSTENIVSGSFMVSAISLMY